MARGRIKQDIQITGNPKNLRSYLYPTDAVRQLLLQTYPGESSYSQVGSSVSITIAETGIAIADMYGVKLKILNQRDAAIDNYAPQDVPMLEEVIFNQGLNRWRKWLNYMDLN